MRKVDFAARYAHDYNHWLRREGEHFLFGLTDWAQYTIGNIVQLDNLPTIGNSFHAEQNYLTVESNKATTELLAPMALEVVALNKKIITNPNLINTHCYGDGWLLKITLPDEKDWLLLKSGEWYKNEIDNLFRK